MKFFESSGRSFVVVALWSLCVSLQVGASSAAHAATQPPNLVVASHNNDSILEFDGATGALLRVLVAPGSGGLHGPQGMVFGPDMSMYVSSWYTGSVKRYDGRTGAYLGDFVASGSGGLSHPDTVRFGPDGGLYVSDRFSGSVLHYDGKTGVFLGTLTSDPLLGGFVNFAFGPDKDLGPDRDLYASMFNGSQRIRRYDGNSGAFIDAFGQGLPSVDSAYAGITFGIDGMLYTSRFHASRIERFNPSTGAFDSVFIAAGSGGLDHPRDLAFGTDGRLYVASQNSNQVLRFDAGTGAFLDAFASAGLDSAVSFAFVPPEVEPRPTPIPEPSTWLMTLAGLCWLVAVGTGRRDSRGSTVAR